MRARNENLRTGSLLTHFEAGERLRNRSLLFLVEGAKDVEPLTRAEQACRQIVEEVATDGTFEWNAVADQGELTDVDPCLDLAAITRLEAAELVGLDDEELRRLFRPAIERLAKGSPELFPGAGGAVGNPAEGLQLLGRDSFVQELDTRLAAGEDLYLSAPRRSGKTSVLLQLEKVAHLVRAAFVDLERARDERHAVALVRAQLRGETPRAALAVVGKNWRQDLVDSLVSATLEGARPAALLLDELVFFLDGLRSGSEEAWRRAVEGFLAATAEALEHSHCRLVVSGSADLFDFLREHVGIREEQLPPRFRRLARVRLPLLANDPVELRRLLLGTGLVLTPEELHWLEETLDLSLPYPALLFLDHLVVAARGRSTPVGAAALEAELAGFLVRTPAFHEFQDRLHRRAGERPDLREPVHRLLDRLAEGPLSRQDLEAALPEEGDRFWFFETYPVLLEGERASLVSKLFGRWWRLAGV